MRKAIWIKSLQGGFVALGTLGNFVSAMDYIDTFGLISKGIITGTSLLFSMWLVAFLLCRKSGWFGWAIKGPRFASCVMIILAGIPIARMVNFIYEPQAPDHSINASIFKNCTLICGSGKGSTRHSLYGENCYAGKRTLVLDHYAKLHKNCRIITNYEYEFSINNWHPKINNPVNIDVSNERFDATQQGKKIPVDFHTGLLGIVWVDKNQFFPEKIKDALFNDAISDIPPSKMIAGDGIE